MRTFSLRKVKAKAQGPTAYQVEEAEFNSVWDQLLTPGTLKQFSLNNLKANRKVMISHPEQQSYSEETVHDFRIFQTVVKIIYLEKKLLMHTLLVLKNCKWFHLLLSYHPVKEHMLILTHISGIFQRTKHLLIFGFC